MPGIRVITLSCMLIMVTSGSGCQVANTMFQIDSDSSVPQFGINLIPSKGWFGNRGISYNQRKIKYDGKQKTGSIEVIDLPAAPNKVKGVQVKEVHGDIQIKMENIKVLEPVVVDLPSNKDSVSTLNTSELFND